MTRSRIALGLLLARFSSCWLGAPAPAAAQTKPEGEMRFAFYVLQAVGIRTRIRTMERAAFISEWGAKKLREVCACTVGVYGNAASRMSEYVPSTGTYAYGGWPDVDAL